MKPKFSAPNPKKIWGIDPKKPFGDPGTPNLGPREFQKKENLSTKRYIGDQMEKLLMFGWDETNVMLL